MTTREMLEKLQHGEISVDEAERFFRQEPYEELGFAKLDTWRSVRTGFPEVVFCAGKPDTYLARIFRSLYEKHGEVMGTRATWEQFELVRAAFEDLTVSAEPEFADTDKAGSTPDEVQNADGIGSQRKTVALKDALLQYDAVSRILKIEKREKEHTGLIAVCTGGTSDIPVAEEAAATAEYFGARCVRIYDVGVSGLHRLFSALREIQQANCVIAVAGMEGALPSVLGGLVENPVIAVPSSVGYGASFGGLSALLTMINSCANGIAVVNIDNGFGAGYLATQVNRLATAGQGKTD